MISKRGWKTINSLVMILFWILIGTVFFFYLENWTLIDSFYFAVSSLTTVGYGDLTPTTQFSKLIAALYILFGVGIVFASLGVLGREFLRKEELNLRRKYAHSEKKQIEEVKEVESEIKSVKRLLKKNTITLKEKVQIDPKTKAKIKK